MLVLPMGPENLFVHIAFLTIPLEIALNFGNLRTDSFPDTPFEWEGAPTVADLARRSDHDRAGSAGFQPAGGEGTKSPRVTKRPCVGFAHEPARSWRSHRDLLVVPARLASLSSCLIESYVGFAHEPARSRRSQRECGEIPIGIC